MKLLSLGTFSIALACQAASAIEPSRVDEPESKQRTTDNALNFWAPETFVVAVPANPIDVPKPGEGFDLVKGVRRPANCIQHGGVVETTIGSAQSYLTEATDDEMFWRKASSSMEAKASYAGWSGGGSFAQTVETRTSSTHVTVVARANFITRAVNLAPAPNAIAIGMLPSSRIDLTDRAFNLIANNAFAEFRSTCGDGYIAQVSEGAYFVSFLDFETKDFNSKKEVTTALNVSGPGDVFRASGKSKIQTEMDLKSTRLKIESSQLGGDITVNPSTKQQLIDAFASLPARAQTKPSALYLTVVRYGALPSVQHKKLRASPFWVYADQAMRQLLRLQTVKNELARALQQITAAAGDDPSSNPQDFLYFPQIEVKRRSLNGYKNNLKELESLTAELGQWLGKCMASGTEASCTPDAGLGLNKYDDLVWRARVPLAKADISPDLEADIRARATSTDPASQLEAKCYLAQVIQSNGVRRIAALRQKYDNASNEAVTEKAEAEVMEGLGVTAPQCSPLIDAPQQAASLSLDSVRRSLLVR
jgi:hypothetical protein